MFIMVSAIFSAFEILLMNYKNQCWHSCMWIKISIVHYLTHGCSCFLKEKKTGKIEANYQVYKSVA